jgi:hypothetical protein
MPTAFSSVLSSLPTELQQLVLASHICAVLKAPLLLYCAQASQTQRTARLVEALLAQVYEATPCKVLDAKSQSRDAFLASLILRSTNTLPKALIIRNAQKLSPSAQAGLSNALRDRRIALTEKESPDDAVWQPSPGSYLVPNDFLLVLICSTPPDAPYLGLDPHLVRLAIGLLLLTCGS